MLSPRLYLEGNIQLLLLCTHPTIMWNHLSSETPITCTLMHLCPCHPPGWQRRSAQSRWHTSWSASTSSQPEPHTPANTHRTLQTHLITTPSCLMKWSFYFLIEIFRMSEGSGAASSIVFATADGYAVIFGFFIPTCVLPVRVIVDATTPEL